MTTIARVRDAMKGCVETIPGLRATAYIQDAINVPVAHIVPLDYDPRDVLGEGSATYPFQIRIYVARAPAEQNQALLDGYREISGSQSILAAIQNVSFWNDVDHDYATVTRVGAVTVVEVSGVPYLYVEIDVEVCWS